MLFYIIDPENKTDMLPKDRTGLICGGCKMPLNDDYVNPDYRPPKNCPDLSHTYDGFHIASERLKEVLLSAGYTGLRFAELPRNEHYYSFGVSNVLEQTKPAGVVFEEKCPSCGRFVSVWGLSHAKVRVPARGLRNGLYRSDFKMGYRLMMFYNFIATEDVVDLIKKSKLRGITFKPAPIEPSGAATG